MAEPFNTLEAARRLQEAGCDQRLAEEMASQINGAVSGAVATKADVELLRGNIERLEATTKADVERLETRMELLKSQLTNRLWIAIGTFVVLMKALDYLLPAILS